MKSNIRSVSIILALVLVLSLCGCVTADVNTASPSPSIVPTPTPTTNTYSKPTDILSAHSEAQGYCYLLKSKQDNIVSIDLEDTCTIDENSYYFSVTVVFDEGTTKFGRVKVVESEGVFVAKGLEFN